MAGPVLKHAVGETAGGSADIHSLCAGKIQTETLHRLLQLQSAPADVGTGRLDDSDLRVLVYLRPRLIDPLSVHQNDAGHDGGLGFLSRFEQTALGGDAIKSVFHFLSLFLSSVILRAIDAPSSP